MAKPRCDACEDLRENSPNLIVNGLGDTECASLKNNTGLNPSSGNDDCTDLENLNDCLIGNMEQEIDAYDVCDWKEYMRKFVENAWTVFKGIICAICGIWTNIKDIWAIVNKLRCQVDYLFNSENISSQLDESAFVAGTGVSFNRQDEHIVKPSVVISGSTYTVGASIKVSGTNTHWKNLGLTNDGETVSGNKLDTPDGNYTLFIIKIPKAQFPEIKSLSSCVGNFVNAGIGHIFVQVVDSGGEYAGQWGNSESGRVTVPSGEMHIRVALSGLVTWGIEYGDNEYDVTVRATGLAVTNSNGIEC